MQKSYVKPPCKWEVKQLIYNSVAFITNMKKIFCLILIWLVAFQAIVFVSSEEPLDYSFSVHCKNKDMMINLECCQQLATTLDFSNCFQPTLALAYTVPLSLIDDNH